MSEKFTFVWWRDGASEAEIHTWNKLKDSSSIEDIDFIELQTKKDYEKTCTELKQVGWKLVSSGSGSMARITSFKRME